MPIVALAVIIVMALAGAAGAYKTGLTNGANSERLRWQQSIAEANAKAEAEAEARRRAIQERDQAQYDLSALNKKNQEAANVQATANQAATPPSVDCTRCNIPRNHYVAGVRPRSTAPDSDSKASVPGTGTK